MENVMGQLAALGTAFCWMLSTIFFTAAGKRIGSMALNQIRLVMALALLALYGWLVRGLAFPTDATAKQWWWLGASGVVGFTLGDLCLFRSYLLIGPRLSSLVMALWPPMAAVAGWLILNEVMSGWEWLAMLITLAGVVWVVSERQPRSNTPEDSDGKFYRGVALAFLGAAGQAVGYVLAKPGKLGFDPFAATQIRVLFGIAGFGVIFTFSGWWPRLWQGCKNRQAMALSSIGAMVGPVLGVSLSMIALEKAPVGVASTIMSVVPVIIIPYVVLVDKERVSLRAVAGAVLAVAGVAMLFYGPRG